MEGVRKLVSDVARYGVIAGSVSAVASGTVAWGPRFVKLISTQNVLGATVAGGIFGFFAAATLCINGFVGGNKEESFLGWGNRQSLLRMKALPVGMGILATQMVTPTVASWMNREISRQASGIFGGISAVVLGILIEKKILDD